MQRTAVTLRPVSPDDYPLLLEWQNDLEISRWMDYHTPFTRSEIEQDQERAAREGLPFVIELEGRPVGKCGLNQFRRRAAACSLYLYVGDRDVWNRGVGREAVMSLLAIAFEERGMERVELTMLTDNHRAQRVYEVCGFEAQGVLRGRSAHKGGWIETTVMAVSRIGHERVREAWRG